MESTVNELKFMYSCIIILSRISSNESKLPFLSVQYACLSESTITHLFFSGNQTEFTTWQSLSVVSLGLHVITLLAIPTESRSSYNIIEWVLQLKPFGCSFAHSHKSIALYFIGLGSGLSCFMDAAICAIRRVASQVLLLSLIKESN